MVSRSGETEPVDGRVTTAVADQTTETTSRRSLCLCLSVNQSTGAVNYVAADDC